jgi:hypothetical protein
MQAGFSGNKGQKVGGGTEPAGEYTFFFRKRNTNHDLGTGLCT